MKPQFPSLKDVTRIVINRIAVWDLMESCEGEHWRKIKGGPGFDPDRQSRGTCKLPSEMRGKINAILSRKERVHVFQNRNVTVFEEPTTYRWWRSGETLNIVRKDLKKDDCPECCGCGCCGGEH